MIYAISPHNDDETIYLAYTLLRRKPHVYIVTDSYIQFNRGDNITAEQRRDETRKAMEILGCSVTFLGIRDDQITEEEVRKKLTELPKPTEVFIPAIQGGNWQHDLIGKVAGEVFPYATRYTTYTKTELHTKGSIELKPTKEEQEFKEKAIWCYQSQIKLPATRPHFEAVLNKSEYYL